MEEITCTREELIKEIQKYYPELPIELVEGALIGFKVKQLKDAEQFLNGRKKKKNVSRIIRRVEALSGEAK